MCASRRPGRLRETANRRRFSTACASEQSCWAGRRFVSRSTTRILGSRGRAAHARALCSWLPRSGWGVSASSSATRCHGCLGAWPTGAGCSSFAAAPTLLLPMRKRSMIWRCRTTGSCSGSRARCRRPSSTFSVSACMRGARPRRRVVNWRRLCRAAMSATPGAGRFSIPISGCRKACARCSAGLPGWARCRRCHEAFMTTGCACRYDRCPGRTAAIWSGGARAPRHFTTCSLIRFTLAPMLGAVFAVPGPNCRSRTDGAISCVIVTRPISAGRSSNSTCASLPTTGMRFEGRVQGSCRDCCIAGVAGNACGSRTAIPEKQGATAAGVSGTTAARPVSRCRRAGWSASFRKQ